MISLNQDDRLRVINSSSSGIGTQEIQDLILCIRFIIQKSWPKGIQSERLYAGAHEFKFSGNPWWANGKEAVHSRGFIAELFEELLKFGWAIHCTVELSRKINDKSVFVLRSCAPTQLHHMCVSLNEIDIIRMIRCPPDALQVVKSIIYEHYTHGVQEELQYGESYQFKLKGCPWAYNDILSNCTVTAKSMLCFLLKGLMNLGWVLVSSADVSAKYYKDKNEEYPLDVHSFWFAKSIPITGNVVATAPFAAATNYLPSSDFYSQYNHDNINDNRYHNNIDFSQQPPSYEDIMKES